MRILCVDPVCRDCATPSPPFRIHSLGDPFDRVDPKKDADVDGVLFECLCDCKAGVSVRSNPSDFAIDIRRMFLSKHVGAGHTVTRGFENKRRFDVADVTNFDTKKPRRRK